MENNEQIKFIGPQRTWLDLYHEAASNPDANNKDNNSIITFKDYNSSGNSKHDFELLTITLGELKIKAFEEIFENLPNEEELLRLRDKVNEDRCPYSEHQYFESLVDKLYKIALRPNY